jgi:hypothetical protein
MTWGAGIQLKTVTYMHKPMSSPAAAVINFQGIQLVKRLGLSDKLEYSRIGAH